MKKRTIWTILALMLIGLLGIVVVQVYWLSRASALEQSLFKEHVHRALNNVARQLEIRETKALIMQSLNDVRKTAEAVKIRRTMSVSRKSSPKQFAQAESQVPANTTAKHTTDAKSLARSGAKKSDIKSKVDSSAITVHKSASDAEKNVVPRSNKNPFLSVEDSGASFEMSLNDGNISFHSSRERANKKGTHSYSVSPAPKTMTVPSTPHQPIQMPTAPAPPPQGLVVTIPTADGQPFRFIIPNSKAYRRDSIAQRFRRSSSNGVYSASGSSKTLEDKISAAERGMENPSSGAGREAMSSQRDALRAAQRDAQRELRALNQDQLKAHFQREFAKSQQMINRLRSMQGVNTRDVDSMFNMAFRQTWQDMGAFSFEMRMLPPSGSAYPMNQPAAPHQPTAETAVGDADERQPVQKKQNGSSSTQRHQETKLQSAAESRPQSRDTIGKILDKVELIENILENMVSRKQSTLERVPLTDLETLLAAELRGNGVTSRYEYGIMHGANMHSSVPRNGRKQDSMLIVRTSTNNAAAERSTPHISAALRTSEFQVQLFPNDILGNEEKDYLALYFPDQTQGLTLAGIAPVLGSSALFLMLIIGCFGFTLLALMKQKKLSDMKTDFINNMTHELKTPIATISIASEALKDDHVRSESIRVERFVNIIHDENKRLAGHVEKVLQAAQMDRGELNLKFVSTDAHQLIGTVAESLALQLEQKQGRIELCLEAHTHILQVDEAHFRNVLVNLLDNANKYSPDVPHIIVSTRNTLQELVLTIQDNGIGMTREAQKQIFEKFYRVPTGNRHDVKGFGLGLNYVKTIVEAHGGTVSVKSEQGKGSTFEVVMPLSPRGYIAS